MTTVQLLIVLSVAVILLINIILHWYNSKEIKECKDELRENNIVLNGLARKIYSLQKINNYAFLEIKAVQDYLNIKWEEEKVIKRKLVKKKKVCK